ncbi:hypothetical protein GQ56_0107260 [Burkholderia paludis]|nr:hypothetical protein GQ56_0107260 [Burkholderia paludis]
MKKLTDMIEKIRITRFAISIGMTLALSACLAPHSYVDKSLGEPHYADFKKSETPQPIQLLVEFQTKGVANARVTEALRPRVFEQVSQSGLFSRVSYDPVPSGRKLSITVNNIPLTDNVAAKGFGTGLTLGLVGTMVTDGYVCTTNYLEPGHDPVTTTVKHAIHTTIGNASGPEGLQQMSVQEASATMLRQIVGKSLEQIDQASDLAQ